MKKVPFHFNLTYFLLVIIASGVIGEKTLAQPRCVQIVGSLTSAYAGVSDVKIESSRIEVINRGGLENRVLELELLIQSYGGQTAQPQHLELMDEQSSVSSRLSPSEFFFKLRNQPDARGGLAVLTQNETVKILWKVGIGHRSVVEPPSPWQRPTTVQFFNFYAGLIGGLNYWNLYRLDLTDPEKPALTLVKKYAISEGEAR